MQLGPFKLRHLVFLAGLGLAPFVLLLVVLTIFTPITTSGTFYTLGVVEVAVGAIAVLWRPRLGRNLILVGFATMAAVAGVRLVVGGQGTTVTLVTLPDQGDTRLLNRLIHERDLGLFGQQAAFLTGIGLSADEHDGLTAALTDAYARMDAVGGTTASPMFSTYLFLQRPGSFDTVIIEPPGVAAPQSAVIFLHGFGGNFAVQGWLVAEAARKLNMLTVCPSVGFIGNWWTPQGEETIRATIDYLRRRGIRRIYLAGLSNGAVGICRQAGRLRTDVAGLVLISGADRRAPDAGLPVLALHGRYDERMSAESAKAYVQQAGDRGTYHEFDGDHLLLAKRAREVQAVLETWLRQQELQAAAP